jgi:hypothetical protein
LPARELLARQGQPVAQDIETRHDKNLRLMRLTYCFPAIVTDSSDALMEFR